MVKRSAARAGAPAAAKANRRQAAKIRRIMAQAPVMAIA
jgi:hypothetical protein